MSEEVFSRWQDPTIEKLQQENKTLKEELQKADSITQSCIFEGKEKSTINFRECLNKLDLYKEVIDEVREISLIMKHCELLLGGKQKTNADRILEILDRAKGE